MGLDILNRSSNHYIGNSPHAKRINRAIRKFAKVDKNMEKLLDFMMKRLV